MEQHKLPCYSKKGMPTGHEEDYNESWKASDLGNIMSIVFLMQSGTVLKGKKETNSPFSEAIDVFLVCQLSPML